MTKPKKVAKRRKGQSASKAMLKRAVLEEREACARIAETLKITINGQSITEGFGSWVADTIRARSNAEVSRSHD